MTEKISPSSGEDRRSGAVPDPGWARLLLAAERAVDIGAQLLIQGRSHIGAVIGKGDRDFATDVDLQIESAIKGSLAEVAPGDLLLGRGGGRGGGFWRATLGP